MTWVWHVHHDRLIEPLEEPLGVRVAYITAKKPPHEVALRLRLLKPVIGRLPEAVLQAWEAFVTAREAYVTARKNYVTVTDAYTTDAYTTTREAFATARDACVKVLTDHWAEIEALHAQECPDCPWDGQTIFPEAVQP